jgi:hypothetical protein
MRVFHLTTVHPRYDNRVLNKQCVSLAKHFDTYLVVADGKGDKNYRGVKILDSGKSKGRLTKMFSKTFKVFWMAQSYNPDVIHIHDPELLSRGFLYSLIGKKIIYDIHEDYTTAIKIKHYIPVLLKNPLALFIGSLEHVLSFRMSQVIAEKYYK